MNHPATCRCDECERDAREWAECCRAMLQAESNHFERFAPHLADTEYEDSMGWS